MAEDEQAAARELGLQQVPKGGVRLRIVRQLLDPAGLPLNWQAKLEADGRRRYENLATGKVQHEHPHLAYFRGALFMEQSGLQQCQKSLQTAPPSQDEVQGMAEYLGIAPGDPPEVQEVARLALVAPAPPGWEHVLDDEGDLVFKHQKSGTVQAEQPLDEYFMLLVARRRRGLQQQQEQQQQQQQGPGEQQAGEHQEQPPPQQGAAASRRASTAALQHANGTDVTAATSSKGSKSSDSSNGSNGGRQSSSPLVLMSQHQLQQQGVPALDLAMTQQARQQAAADHENADPPGSSAGTDDGDHEEEPEGQLADAPLSFRPLRASVTEELPEPSTSAVGVPGDTAGAGSRERIRVAVRARPVTDENEALAWALDAERCHVSLQRHALAKGRQASSMHGEQVFAVDAVFGPGSTTQELFDGHVLPVVASALLGIHGTVLAYGQTGSGKTHTVIGPHGTGQDGLLGIALQYLFSPAASNAAAPTTHAPAAAASCTTAAASTAAADTAMKPGGSSTGGVLSQELQSEATQKLSRSFTLDLSMMELYNEELRDLLAVGHGPRPPSLKLLEDSDLGVRVVGLHNFRVTSVQQALQLIAQGLAARVTGATAQNEHSSRSHAIFRLQLQVTPATGPALHSVLHLVDLAGCERLSKTKAKGQRFTEGTSINLSLLMLGNVVAKLAEGRTADHIPFRNSQLTRLLQPCLGGNARTAVVATIHPGASCVDEALNTLQFAQRAMAVVNQVWVNEAPDEVLAGSLAAQQLVQKYKRQVQQLTGQLNAAKLAKQQLLAAQAKVAALEREKAQMALQLERSLAERLRSNAAASSSQPGGTHAGSSRSWQSQRCFSDDGADDGNCPSGSGGAQSVMSRQALIALAGIISQGSSITAGSSTSFGDILEAVQQLVQDRHALQAELYQQQLLVQQESDQRTALGDRMQLQGAVEAAVAKLDRLLGPAPGQAKMHLLERLQEGTDATALLVHELTAVARQLRATEAALAAADARAALSERLVTEHIEECRLVRQQAGLDSDKAKELTAALQAQAQLLVQQQSALRHCMASWSSIAQELDMQTQTTLHGTGSVPVPAGNHMFTAAAHPPHLALRSSQLAADGASPAHVQASLVVAPMQDAAQSLHSSSSEQEACHPTAATAACSDGTPPAVPAAPSAPSSSQHSTAADGCTSWQTHRSSHAAGNGDSSAETVTAVGASSFMGLPAIAAARRHAGDAAEARQQLQSVLNQLQAADEELAGAQGENAMLQEVLVRAHEELQQAVDDAASLRQQLVGLVQGLVAALRAAGFSYALGQHQQLTDEVVLDTVRLALHGRAAQPGVMPSINPLPPLVMGQHQLQCQLHQQAFAPPSHLLPVLGRASPQPTATAAATAAAAPIMAAMVFRGTTISRTASPIPPIPGRVAAGCSPSYSPSYSPSPTGLHRATGGIGSLLPQQHLKAANAASPVAGAASLPWDPGWPGEGVQNTMCPASWAGSLASLDTTLQRQAGGVSKQQQAASRRTHS